MALAHLLAPYYDTEWHEARTRPRLTASGVTTITMDICPIAEAARLLGDKWTLIILRDLMQGPCRFKDLERTGEGISPSVLTARLHDLEVHGIVSRTAYREIPPRVEYTLTDKGYDAAAVVEALRSYGEKWLVKNAVRNAVQNAVQASFSS